MNRRELLRALAGGSALLAAPESLAAPRELERFLYVAVPGIRNYVEFGGVGVLVFDIERGHRFVRRIPLPEIQSGDSVENVKGICASARTGRLYVSTIRRLLALDLVSGRVLWNRTYEGGCDRMAITPDGRTIYMPSLEGPHWLVLDAASGDIVTRIVLNSGAHNTLVGLKGDYAYLAGLKSPLLRVVETQTHRIVREVGPFGNVIRPFTVNGRGTRCYVNVNELLGFEVGDLTTGKRLWRVEVPGFSKGPVKRHGCPSHGIGLTPCESELWLADAYNERVHIFDATAEPPKWRESIHLREQPGWVTFGMDGRYAYPSTGEVIDLRTKQIVAALSDETGRPVHSEKVVEIVFREGQPLANGDQFGMGRLL